MKHELPKLQRWTAIKRRYNPWQVSLQIAALILTAVIATLISRL